MSESGYSPGWQEPSDGATDYNKFAFLVQQFLSIARTAAIVQVRAVHGGGLNPVGTVDVQVLVKLIDSLGNVSSHGTIYNLPWFRLQGGANAVICDPQVNDIGCLVVADRDISTVKSTKAESPPGSFRRFDLADGMYFGGFLGNTPTQYVQFTSTGIVIHDLQGNDITTDASGIKVTDKNGNTILMESDGIKINGVLFDRSQNITNVNDITATDGVELTGHVHGGVQTGTGTTGPPSG